MKGIMRDLNYCDFFEQKNFKLIDLILYKSIIKSLEKSDFLTFDLHHISEYILVIYFKLIRNTKIPLEEREYVQKNVARLIEKSGLVIIKKTSELSDKEFFISLKSHSEYTNTVDKIKNHIDRFTIIKNQLGPNDKLLYEYDLSKKNITILEKEKLVNSLNCINLCIDIILKINESSQRDDFGRELTKKANLTENKISDIKPKIPKYYQLTKHKTMKTRVLFEQYEKFLKANEIRYQDADINQFYMYLKNNYKNQSYNRNALIQFVKEYYRSDYILFIDENQKNLTNQFRYFKDLDLMNVELGFNLTEHISINDLNNLLNKPKTSSINNEVDSNPLKREKFEFLSYFHGLEYTNTSEIERYNAYLDNQKILKNYHEYNEKMKYQLSLVDESYSRKDILNYVKNSGRLKLHEILLKSDFWDSKEVFLKVPYLLITFIDVLSELSKPLLFKVEEFINSILTDKEQFIHQKRFDKETLEVIGNKLGVTRERVRQIEAKAKRKLKSKSNINTLKKLNLLVLSKFTDIYYIKLEDLESILGEFSSIFIDLNTYHNDNFAYYKHEEYVTFKKYDLIRVENFISTFENYFSRDDFDSKIDQFRTLFPKINPAVFDTLVLKKFQINSNYYFDKEYFKNKSDRVKFILTEFYIDGIKAFDDKSINEFKRLYQQLFGIDDFKDQSKRTIGSYITRYTKIVGRGLYSIYSKSLKIEQEILDYVRSLIFNSKLLYKETLFYKVKSKFDYLDINSVEEFSRVLKKYIKYPSNRFYYAVDEIDLDYQRYLVEFLEQNSGVFRIEDIETEFRGINHKTILNVYNQSELVLSNSNHRYIHVKHVGLNNQELNLIKAIIDELTETNRYIHVLDVYERILIDETIEMDEEVLNDSLGLFNVVKYYFNEIYNLHRPLIGKKNAFIGSFESMLDHYFFSSEVIKIKPIKEFIDYMQKPISIHAIFESHHPKYYLVNSNEFRLKSSLGINEQVANVIEKIMKNFMVNNPNLGIEDFKQWDFLPKIKVDWTPQLIYSLAIDVFKDITFKFSNKSYNNLKYRIEWRF